MGRGPWRASVPEVQKALELLLGVDVGTTRTKATVVDTCGKELAWASVPTRWQQLAMGAETSAEQLLRGVLEAAAAALEAAPPGSVVGAGVTSLAETAVYLDAGGRPAAPCIAWYDSRGQEAAAGLEETFGAEGFSRHTGLAVSAMCTIAKLKWHLAKRGPAPRSVLSVADWVVHALGGELASEASLASRTGALDVPGRRWWGEVLEWAGAEAGTFPPLVPAGTSLGKATLDRAFQLVGAIGRDQSVLARLEGAALTSAGHDHLCAAAGVGATSPAQVLDSCGTTEALVRAVGPLDRDGLARAVQAGLCVSWHTVPGHDALLIGNPLGMVLDRVLRLLGMAGAEAAEQLDLRSEGVAPGRLRVVSNGFSGDPAVEGLHPEVCPEALWSAAVEEVSANAAAALAVITDFGGPAEELLLSGGWARSAGLRRRRLGLLPRLRWPAVTEAGARGAALFGGCAAGLFEGPTVFPAPADQPLAL